MPQSGAHIIDCSRQRHSGQFYGDLVFTAQQHVGEFLKGVDSVITGALVFAAVTGVLVVFAVRCALSLSGHILS